MSNITGPAPSLQALTPSHIPLGKPVAGLESAESKDQTLPPVEEAGAGEKNRHQPNQPAAAVTRDGRRSGGRGAGRDGTAVAEEPQAECESVTECAAEPAEAPSAVELALQRAAALSGDTAPGAGGSGVAASIAVDRFNAAAGQTPAPGSLLDQRS